MFRPTVPIQTRYPPQNVRFEIADVTERLRFSDASVDVVHARMACLRVRSCHLSYKSFLPNLDDVGDQPEVVPNFLREVARVLRPGGLFLSAEWGIQPTLYHEHPPFVDDDVYIPKTVSFYKAASYVGVLSSHTPRSCTVLIHHIQQRHCTEPCTTDPSSYQTDCLF